MRIRPHGPENVVRPFQPAPGLNEPIEQIADALDKIALTLAAIDHNLEVLTKTVEQLAARR